MSNTTPAKGEVWCTRGNRRALVVLATARTWLGENVAVVKYEYADGGPGHSNPQPLLWSELVERVA